MDEELAATIAGCIAAHRRLEATIASVGDEVVARPSRLPGWTVGHVLTHIARNADVRSTSAELEAAWDRTGPAAWAGRGLARGTEWPCRWLPFHRWREVELHHVDLGLGYEAADWPAEYLDRELPLALATVAARLTDDGDRAAVLAWLVGRGEQPSIELSPWQDHYRSVPPALQADPRSHPPTLG